MVSGDGRLSGVRVVSNGNRPQIQNFGYDRVGQLTTLASTGYTTYTLAYTYDAAGQLRQRQPAAGGGLTLAYAYDPAGQMTRLAISGTQGLLLAEDYTYDAAGNLLTITSAQGGNFTYGYDASNRLTSATGPSLTASYNYDAAGNRTAAGGVNFTYDAGGRLTGGSDGASYSYDAAGNLRTRTRGGATDTFTWDGQGRLTRIDYGNGTFSAYGYDDAGRRISKRKPDGTTIYYVYAGNLLAQELNAAGAVLASYTYDGLDRPVTLWRGGQTYTYLLDRLGSVRGLADAAGNLVATYRYDPWGNLLASTGTLANPLRFTSREYDEESGLYFYRARYYDPVVGRFVSRDPIGISSEDGNLYAYARGNPVGFIDPFGLQSNSYNLGEMRKYADDPNNKQIRENIANKLMNQLSSKGQEWSQGDSRDKFCKGLMEQAGRDPLVKFKWKGYETGFSANYQSGMGGIGISMQPTKP
jgi:RHS repeat-associated protein